MRVHRLAASAATPVLVLLAGAGCAIWREPLCSQSREQTKQSCPEFTTTEGVGIIVAERHVSIGWMKELYLQIPDPDDCRLIVVVEKRSDLEAVAKLLKESGSDLARVCTNDKVAYR